MATKLLLIGFKLDVCNILNQKNSYQTNFQNSIFLLYVYMQEFTFIMFLAVNQSYPILFATLDINFGCYQDYFVKTRSYLNYF